MAKIIFNEDCNHFLYDRYAAGVRRLEKEHILDFLAQYENTGVTDFLVCVGSSTPWFETKTRDNVLDTYHRWQKEGKVPQDSSEAHFGQLALLDDFYQREGKTVISFLLEHVRDFGMRPWASLRMNDIHEASAEDSLLFSDFYRKIVFSHKISSYLYKVFFFKKFALYKLRIVKSYLEIKSSTPFMKVNGWTGHPGIYKSIGYFSKNSLFNFDEFWKTPPEIAQAPARITILGSGVCL